MNATQIQNAILNGSQKNAHYALTVVAQHNFILGGQQFGESLLNWWENNGDWTNNQHAALKNMLVKNYLPLLVRHEQSKAKPEPVAPVVEVANLGEEIDF